MLTNPELIDGSGRFLDRVLKMSQLTLSFNCSLPIDGPPQDLLGAPVVGSCHRTLHLHPERTGMGVNCNTFLVLGYFTDVLSNFFRIVEQLKCFLILQCLSSTNFDNRRICSFHFFKRSKKSTLNLIKDRKGSNSNKKDQKEIYQLFGLNLTFLINFE